jgi:hypothetical protein
VVQWLASVLPLLILCCHCDAPGLRSFLTDRHAWLLSLQCGTKNEQVQYLESMFTVSPAQFDMFKKNGNVYRMQVGGQGRGGFV